MIRGCSGVVLGSSEVHGVFSGHSGGDSWRCWGVLGLGDLW